MVVNYTTRSDTGHKRGNNEDNFYCDSVTLTMETRKAPFVLDDEANTPCMFAVCDGMGGEEDGEFASLTAVNTLSEFARRIIAAPTDQLDAMVQAYIAKTNSLLCEAMRERNVRMGTTFVLANIRSDGVHAYSIGDSRIYALCDSEFKQLSTDHTLVTPKIKMGLLTDEQARKDKDWHKLTAYLGVFEDELEVCADVLPVLPLEGSMRLLMCSDGLTDMVLDEQIEQILRKAATTTNAANMLLSKALENGGNDNVTITVIDVSHQTKAKKQSVFSSAKLTVTELPKILKWVKRGIKNERH